MLRASDNLSRTSTLELAVPRSIRATWDASTSAFPASSSIESPQRTLIRRKFQPTIRRRLPMLEGDQLGPA